MYRRVKLYVGKDKIIVKLGHMNLVNTRKNGIGPLKNNRLKEYNGCEL
jgi:hypothetical protein